MDDNICHHSPSRKVQVILKFDKPTTALAHTLGIEPGKPFSYSVSVARNGGTECRLNDKKLDHERRPKFLNGITIVHVPPIRDITAEGLEPFRKTLATALSKTRGEKSFSRLNHQVREAVQEKGRLLLDGIRDITQNMLRVDELAVDTESLDLEDLLASAALKVRTGGRYFGLDKLGTGHQSSVILKLYRQLGEVTDSFVLYLFEEPDNHLHPTSLRAIAEDLNECAKEADAQVFLTTHSPFLLNQFNLNNLLALENDSQRRTTRRNGNIRRTDREIRIALGRFGLTAAEALMADKVVVVEGPNDVTILRTLIELKTGLSPDRQDILVFPAGGKQLVAELSGFLDELGVNWTAMFDWDAVNSTAMPLFQEGLTDTDRDALQGAAQAIQQKLQTHPNREAKAEKIVKSMLQQLQDPPKHGMKFRESVLDTFIRQNSLLTETEILSLEKAIHRRQPKNWRRILAKINVWIWGDTIESVLITGATAEEQAEKVLRQHRLLPKIISDQSNKRRILLNRLHSCAHEPKAIRDVVETLWEAGSFDRSEVKSAINFLCG
jgi:predicted ATP-dependent endonuclease of OLD family